MQVLTGRNVNSLWPGGMLLLEQHGETQQSRNGPVRVAPWPVVSVYERPQERVLMDSARDANPFFHLMESLWMLAGRDDALFLNRYVGDFGKRFGDGPDEARFIHGAYGHRWRRGMGFDQLESVVSKLKKNHDDRQAVIQMWDAECRPDNKFIGTHGHNDLDGDWKDRPCNTHVYLRVRGDRGMQDHGNGNVTDYDNRVLDITVCCRSNDIVWGAYGANAVHFSVLQEYLAGRIGVGIGRMYQFSSNYHGYTDVLKKYGDPMMLHLATDPYARNEVQAMPMGTDWTMWDEDLRRFMEWHDGTVWHAERDEYPPLAYSNAWFARTATPVAVANRLWKLGHREKAIDVAHCIESTDWRFACVQWMARRMK